jgi:hypothetical protein
MFKTSTPNFGSPKSKGPTINLNVFMDFKPYTSVSDMVMTKSKMFQM